MLYLFYRLAVIPHLSRWGIFHTYLSSALEKLTNSRRFSQREIKVSPQSDERAVFVNHAVTIVNWEGRIFCAVNLEAMSSGIPCVITACGGISYAIR
jgi:hypothetical protein